MRRTAPFLIVVGTVVFVAVWWVATRERTTHSTVSESDRTVVEPSTPEPADPSLTGRADSEGPDVQESISDVAAASAESPAAVRLAAARARLDSVRAALEAAVGTPQDVAAAERDVWLASLEAGEVSEREAYAAIAPIDAKALSFAASLLANGRGTPEAVLRARVRLHQSKKRAGHADERFYELRAELLQMISQDHDARVAARVGSPEDLNRRVLSACREFPLDADVRDEDFERTAAAHRDDLWADLRQLQQAAAHGSGGASDERRIAIELELWGLRLLLEEVDFHTAHAAKARIYEQVLEELRSRKIGVLPTEAELAEAELELHRERFLLGEGDEDYVRRRARVFLAERRRLEALVSSGRLTAGEMAVRIGAWQKRFPGADTLRAWRDDD